MEIWIKDFRIERRGENLTRWIELKSIIEHLELEQLDEEELEYYRNHEKKIRRFKNGR